MRGGRNRLGPMYRRDRAIKALTKLQSSEQHKRLTSTANFSILFSHGDDSQHEATTAASENSCSLQLRQTIGDHEETVESKHGTKLSGSAIDSKAALSNTVERQSFNFNASTLTEDAPKSYSTPVSSSVRALLLSVPSVVVSSCTWECSQSSMIADVHTNQRLSSSPHTGYAEALPAISHLIPTAQPDVQQGTQSLAPSMPTLTATATSQNCSLPNTTIARDTSDNDRYDELLSSLIRSDYLLEEPNTGPGLFNVIKDAMMRFKKEDSSSSGNEGGSGDIGVVVATLPLEVINWLLLSLVDKGTVHIVQWARAAHFFQDLKVNASPHAC